MSDRTEKDASPTLIEFQQIVDGLLAGDVRSHVRRWEIELLLDIEESLWMAKGPVKQVECNYRAVVEESWATEGTRPMKFSDYLGKQPERKSIQPVSAHPKERTA